MRIEETGIDGVTIDLKPLDFLMEKAGFVRTAAWDYERVTYDYKIDTPKTNETIYIRVQGYAVEGEVDSGSAVITLLTPLLGRHYYPHGIEYGEEEGFSTHVLDKTKRVLEQVAESLKEFRTNK
ncbi:YugN family protein [Salirhabdus salicampi]|uniref:YugN family protein n=1 Tax=Salirhabdus salicampi TaxID=476102 RepID=UPI0020C55831|nr:YugN family protein [Salirhabdus salicampi]MCP8616635.1 YugN-like family protein [Salirhabdus salicampi]